MTHLSDYSYLERGYAVLVYLIWAVYLLWRDDRWRGFRVLRRLSWCGHRRRHLDRPEFRVLLTGLLLASMSLSVIYDILSSIVKYREGFTEVDEIIIQTPRKMYSPSNERIVLVADVFLDLSWTLRTSAMFLLQAFWSHVVRPYTGGGRTGSDFMSSREFRCYQVASIVSLILYPTLQGLFLALDEVSLSTIAPQFVSHAEGILVAFLSVITIRRFRRLIRSLRPLRTGCVPLFRYYIRMNILLIIAIAMDTGCLLIINLDTVINQGQLQRHKWAFDLLTRVFNFGFTATYMIMFFILYPIHGAGELAANTYTSSAGATAPTAATPSKPYSPKNGLVVEPAGDLELVELGEEEIVVDGQVDDEFIVQPLQERKSLVWPPARATSRH
jgi:hypothetical protein